MAPRFREMNTSLSLFNSRRINAAMERLALHVQSNSSNSSDISEFYNLCLSLSRGIDYAIGNGEIPPNTKELAMLMKQICQRKNDDPYSQAALMVLMISVKNACNIGWFQMKESEELLTIAYEMGKIYCTPESVNSDPSSCHSAIPIIMNRFYPQMKLGPILMSIEAKAEYGCSAFDFHITKSKVLPATKIYLLVAQTDNIETSACLINPQKVNFLLNGFAIDTRTNVQMDHGPQMPTNVTSMLTFGSNLLQAVGQFNGHYTILVAYMDVTSLPEHPVIPNYVQPPVTSVDSDIIEGPSRISLNCPISFKRIKTPVKGHSCKHFQCFDFENFVNINFKRPSWRCPHCNQSVCYTEIRLDQNMIKILENVGNDIVEVMLNADGSWEAVSENDHDVDKIQSNIVPPQESTDVLDLTNEDNLDIMDTFETAERKPFQDSVPSQFVTSNSTSLGANFPGVDRNVDIQLDSTGLDRSDTQTIGVPEHPVLPVTVSPASNQVAEVHNNSPAMNSAMQNNPFSAPYNNAQLQLNYINSAVNEYWRSSSAPRHINRIPVALPVQSQALLPPQSSVTNLNSLQTSSSSATPHVLSSNPTSAGILSGIERQQLISSALNSQIFSCTPTLQHQSETQNLVAPGQMQNPYIGPAWLSQFRNPQMQQTLNPQPYQPMPSSNTQWSHIQQGGSQAMNIATNLPSRNSQSFACQNPTYVAAATSFAAGQRRPVQSVSRPDELFSSPPDPNWRPASRMRGSLGGQHFSDDIRQRTTPRHDALIASRP